MLRPDKQSHGLFHLKHRLIIIHIIIHKCFHLIIRYLEAFPLLMVESERRGLIIGEILLEEMAVPVAEGHILTEQEQVLPVVQMVLMVLTEAIPQVDIVQVMLEEELDSIQVHSALMAYYTPAEAEEVEQMAEPVEVEMVGNTIETNGSKTAIMELTA
nr:MAG TPA: hypothetical protein [Caudoviricetes sp.]